MFRKRKFLQTKTGLNRLSNWKIKMFRWNVVVQKVKNLQILAKLLKIFQNLLKNLVFLLKSLLSRQMLVSIRCGQLSFILLKDLVLFWLRVHLGLWDLGFLRLLVLHWQILKIGLFVSVVTVQLWWMFRNLPHWQN